MEFLITAYKLILYQPLLNALILFYQFLPGQDLGIAIIFLTILIRLILYPFMVQAIKSQKILLRLQPKIEEIQRKYKDDKEKQVKEIITLYRKEKINPWSSLSSFLIQLPILIALYQVFWQGLKPEAMANLYSFIPRPQTIDPSFFGIINLKTPSFLLALLAGISHFFQTKVFSFKNPKLKKGMTQFSERLQKQIIYFSTIFTFFILLKLPAAIGLYWIVTSLFSILQQYLIFKKEYAQPS